MKITLSLLVMMASVLLTDKTLQANNLEKGRYIYQQICINCHGPELDGGIGPSLVDAFWKHGSSPEAILKTIEQGVPETEMIAYREIYSKEELIAVRDFLLSFQEGMRGLLRRVYPTDYFSQKRLQPDLFVGVESEEEKLIPENIFYFDRNRAGVLHGKAKLYIKKADEYQFTVGAVGRTTIYVNHKEVHYSDEKEKKSKHFNTSFYLKAGVHDLEVMHEEKPRHGYKFHLVLNGKQGFSQTLTGRSLEGNTPRFIKPGLQAKVIRKWIEGFPPRTLYCMLPNKVLLAYDPEKAEILKAWGQAEINQTPSLTDRSSKPSLIKGNEIELQDSGFSYQSSIQLLHYESKGEEVLISSKVDGLLKTLRLAPEGVNSYKVSVK